MKALVPAAGQGTRLFPHTHTKPKAMVRLAGRPILGHILANLSKTPIDEVVVVVGGGMKEQIIDYATGEFSDRFKLTFVEQTKAEGLGHSVYQTEHVVRGDTVMIVLGDMLFENGYGMFLDQHEALGDVDGSLGIKPVDEPQHYGVVESDQDGVVVRLVEKPTDPPSSDAISGVYIIEDTDSLFEGLDYLVSNDIRGAGDEFQLTDALQEMIDAGASLGTFEVEDWYDCGRPETLLEANRVLLSRLEQTGQERVDSSVIIPPVDLGVGVTVEESIVGPNVSVDDGATLTQSIVRDTIVGQSAALESVNIGESIVGDNARVHGEANHLNVGDSSSINL